MLEVKITDKMTSEEWHCSYDATCRSISLFAVQDFINFYFYDHI